MENPVLYILMRMDLDSFNAGKKMAQAAHAANAVEHQFITEGIFIPAFEMWKQQTAQGFGTTIVLGIDNVNIMYSIVDIFNQRDDSMSGIVHDPTYPLVDGKVTHLIPLDTCGYVFVSDKDALLVKSVLGMLQLHP